MKYGHLLAGALLVIVGVSGCAAGGDPTSASDEAVTTTRQAVTTTDVFHGTWNGGNANLIQTTQTSQIQLSVFENKASKPRSVAMSVYASAYDPNSQVCNTETICWDPNDPSTCFPYTWCYYANYTVTQGSGQIGSRDFAVGGRTAALHTDLAADPGFFGQTCTSTATSFNCGPATGTINVTWKANGYSSKSQNGTTDSSYSFGGQTITSRTTGVFSSFSANVSGTALGMDVTGGAGDVSDSKGTNVQKQIFKN